MGTFVKSRRELRPAVIGHKRVGLGVAPGGDGLGNRARTSAAKTHVGHGAVSVGRIAADSELTALTPSHAFDKRHQTAFR